MSNSLETRVALQPMISQGASIANTIRGSGKRFWSQSPVETGASTLRAAPRVHGQLSTLPPNPRVTAVYSRGNGRALPRGQGTPRLQNCGVAKHLRTHALRRRPRCSYSVVGNAERALHAVGVGWLEHFLEQTMLGRGPLWTAVNYPIAVM
jgi:hypothetical protein